MKIVIKKGRLDAKILGLKKVKKRLEGGDFIQDLAQDLNSKIQVRVQSKGVGADGSKMPSYLPAYAAFKSSKGRNTNIRDLTFSGKMWQSLTTQRVSRGAKMFFGGSEDAIKAAANNKRTPFFSLTQSERDFVSKELKKLTKII